MMPSNSRYWLLSYRTLNLLESHLYVKEVVSPDKCPHGERIKAENILDIKGIKDSEMEARKEDKKVNALSYIYHQFLSSSGQVRKALPVYGRRAETEEDERRRYMKYYVGVILAFWSSVLLVMALLCKVSIVKTKSPYCAVE